MVFTSVFAATPGPGVDSHIYFATWDADKRWWCDFHQVTHDDRLGPGLVRSETASFTFSEDDDGSCVFGGVIAPSRTSIRMKIGVLVHPSLPRGFAPEVFFPAPNYNTVVIVASPNTPDSKRSPVNTPAGLNCPNPWEPSVLKRGHTFTLSLSCIDPLFRISLVESENSVFPAGSTKAVSLLTMNDFPCGPNQNRGFVAGSLIQHTDSTLFLAVSPLNSATLYQGCMWLPFTNSTDPMAGVDVTRGAVGAVLPNWGHTGSCSGGLVYPEDALTGREETSMMADTVFYFHMDIQSAGPYKLYSQPFPNLRSHASGAPPPNAATATTATPTTTTAATTTATASSVGYSQPFPNPISLTSGAPPPNATTTVTLTTTTTAATTAAASSAGSVRCTGVSGVLLAVAWVAQQSS